MTANYKPLPNPCKSITHRAVIDGVKFFLTVSLYDNGQPGGLQITCDQSGSTIDGFAEAWASAISLCLQYGVTVKKLIKLFSYQQFEPKGKTDNKDIQFVLSVVDYIARWLALTFKEPIPEQKLEELTK